MTESPTADVSAKLEEPKKDAAPATEAQKPSTVSLEMDWDAVGPSNATPKPELLRRLTTAQKSLSVQLEEGGVVPQTWASDYMSSQALWASDLLRALVKGEEGAPFEKLNTAVLNSAEGLAFIKTHKAGVMLNGAHGYGFMIKKLAQDQYGNSKWSQPVFFAISQGGLGVALGYQTTESVIALLSLGSLDVFKNGITSVGTDLGSFSTDGALVGISGGMALGGSQHLGMSVTNTRSAFCYSRVSGAYFELGMHASRVSHDRQSNVALYGESYDAEKILNSSGQFFSEMMPLIRTINVMGKAALGMR